MAPLPAADFNEDFVADLAWQHDTHGDTVAWLMNGLTLSASQQTHPDRVADSDWKIVATPFLNPDFKSDIVWQHQTQGTWRCGR